MENGVVKRNLTWVVLTVSLMLVACTLAAKAPTKIVGQIVTASWYEINSEILGETRRYAVSLPVSYHQNPTKHYPVIYVLDGHEVRIKGVVGMLESLAHFDLSQQIPEFIVVAIASDNRNYDMTPTRSDLAFKGQVLQEMKDNSGGAGEFADFIRLELIAEIDAQFRTNDSKGLVGMSLGGLLAADILLHKPTMFSHYLIADATYIWDDNYLNKTLLKSQSRLSKVKGKVFIALANNDHLGEVGLSNRKWGNDFIVNLRAVSNNQLKVSSKYFPMEQHGTVMYLAFYYGLIELYSGNDA